MKRLCSLVVVFIMVFTTNSLVFANESREQTVTVKASEYDTLLEYVNSSEEHLEKSGYTKQEILEIDKYKADYANNIVKYSQYTVEQLKSEGFSDEQIVAFKNIDVSKDLLATGFQNMDQINNFLKDNVTRGLTASVSMDVDKSDISGNNIILRAYWLWSGRPVVISFRDTVGFNWTNGFTLDSYDNFQVDLIADKGGYGKIQSRVPKSDKSIPGSADEGVMARFPTGNGSYLNNEGIAYITLRNDDYASTTTISWLYAHGTIQIAGFGISLKGGSLTPTIGSTDMTHGVRTVKF